MEKIYKKALEFWKQGYSIIPLRPKSKIPAIPQWKPYQNKLPTKAELKLWFERTNNNYGIVTGSISELVVIDIDDKNLDISKLELPKTYIVETQNGYHFYYRLPKGNRVSNIVRLDGMNIDIRGDGGYVVGPGSIHQDVPKLDEHGEIIYGNLPNGSFGPIIDTNSGVEYTANDKHPLYSETVAECPRWLLKKEDVASEVGYEAIKSASGKKDLTVKIKNGVGIGERNDTATSIAGRLLASNLDKKTAWLSLIAWNKLNKHPLPEDEVKAVFNSINNKEDEKKRKLNGRNLKKGDLKNIFDLDKRQGIHQIAKFFVKKYKFIAVADSNSEELYIYSDGIYTKAGMTIMKKEVEGILEEHSSTHYLREITAKVKRMVIVERKDFGNKEENLICVKNGILDMKTRKLTPHRSDIIFTNKVPIIYKRDADCPEIKKFLSDILYNEDIDVVQEWFGFAPLRRYLFKKAIIFVGESNTGKSTLLNLLVNFIGGDSVSDVGLYKLTTNTFAAARLYQKLVNVSDDLDFKDIVDVGRFKTACGNAPLEAERKFEEGFGFVNHAKLTFTTNRIPPLKDKDSMDSAYYSRWIVIRCDREFEENEIDPEYIDKITTQEELSGLLNFALDGMDRLLKNRSFSYNKGWEDVRKIMERSSSPLASFVQDELIKNEGKWLSKDEMYNAYAQYAIKNKLPALTKDRIGKQLTRYAYYILDGQQGKNRGWRNVALKTPVQLQGTVLQ